LSSVLLMVARQIDAVNEQIGRFVAWLALAMVLMQFTVVVMRYVFGIGSLYMQEGIVYLHAIVFLAAAGYTLLHDGHVRVDIFYGSVTPRRRAWINLLGVLFLLWPMSVFTWAVSWGYIGRSWAVLEGSQEGSGLPFVYLLKTVILVFTGTLILQGLSLLIKSLHDLVWADEAPVLTPTEEGPGL
jgi:TRAP-type mannitol/chloroaromatic compound transport system permease small subunit